MNANALESRPILAWPALALILSLAIPAAVSAAPVRSEGMAGAGSAVLDGIDAPLGNPARLAFPGGPRLRLFGLTTGVSNSSFSLGDYETYNGRRLSEKDEDDILAKIDGDHLEMNAALGTAGPSLRVAGFAVTTNARANADAGVPKELFRLILDGNTPEEPFELDAAEGGAVAIGEVIVSHARAVPVAGKPLFLGASLKIYQGFARAEIEESSGSLLTTLDGIAANGTLRARTSLGGSGFGFDLGALREVAPHWTASLVLRDLFGSIRWERENEEHITTFTMRETTIEDMQDEDDMVDEETDDYEIGAFREKVPPVVVAGAGHTRGPWTFAADWQQGFEESPGTSKSPRLSLGAEVRPLGWFAARTGVSLGGIEGKSTAFGLTLDPAFFRLDLAVVARGALVPGMGRGIGMGMGLGIDF